MRHVIEKIIKLPRRRKASRSVHTMLKRAETLANENGWQRVIIIGYGNGTHNVINSRMDEPMLVGLLEISKDMVLDPNTRLS